MKSTKDKEKVKDDLFFRLVIKEPFKRNNGALYCLILDGKYLDN